MVASLWSGSWIASQLPLNQIEATASNVRKLRYGIIRQRLRRNGARTGGGASGSRWLDVPGAPDQARRARAEGPAADDVQLSGKRRSGWPNGLRGEHGRYHRTRRRVRGQDPQGREARRPPRRAANEVRAGDQPEDREGARNYDPA